jgi:hypothetical protein
LLKRYKKGIFIRQLGLFLVILGNTDVAAAVAGNVSIFAAAAVR